MGKMYSLHVLQYYWKVLTKVIKVNFAQYRLRTDPLWNGHLYCTAGETVPVYHDIVLPARKLENTLSKSKVISNCPSFTVSS